MTIDMSKLRECTAPDLASAWHQYDQLYHDILDNIPETPGWYADDLLKKRDTIADELARRKRRRLAVHADFTSSVNFIDKDYVKSLTDIVELVRGSTELREVAAGRYRGRCPLHGGDNPTSLSVNADKGVWHCHACHAGGDVFTWIEQRDGVTFPEAVQKLADRAGVEPATPHRASSSGDRPFVEAPKPQRPDCVVLVRHGVH